MKHNWDTIKSAKEPCPMCRQVLWTESEYFPTGRSVYFSRFGHDVECPYYAKGSEQWQEKVVENA